MRVANGELVYFCGKEIREVNSGISLLGRSIIITVIVNDFIFTYR